VIIEMAGPLLRLVNAFVFLNVFVNVICLRKIPMLKTYCTATDTPKADREETFAPIKSDHP
jgi:hypothetical protein